METAHDLAPDDDQITLWTSLLMPGPDGWPRLASPSPRRCVPNHGGASTFVGSSRRDLPSQAGPLIEALTSGLVAPS